MIKEKEFVHFIRRQKETQIVQFVGQILLYKLIYKQKFQHLVSNLNNENAKMYEKILRPNWFFRPSKDSSASIEQEQV
jgi:hypothetical protein